MVDVKVKKIHEKDKNYLVRMCMTTTQVPVPIEGSVEKECEECGVAVWYNADQPQPVVLGVIIDGEVVMCMSCVALHAVYADEPTHWVGPGFD